LKAEGILSVVLEPCALSTLGDVLEEALRRIAATGAEYSGTAVGRDTEEAAIALWIGPESGWSQAESEWFATAGIETARLGQSVLRAETAGPVAVAATRLTIGDW